MLALVTGAAHRLGRAMAIALHNEGYRVCLHYSRSHQAAHDLAANLNASRADSAFCIQADLSDASATRDLAATLQTKYAPVEVLINNASIFMPDDMLSTPAKLHAMQQCNTHSPIYLMEALAPGLTQSGGSIINMSDIYTDFPSAHYTHYCASKQALNAATKKCALAWAPKVRVNGIAPGAALWASSQTEDDDYRKALLASIPMARLGGSRAICEAMLFLLRCDYITGQIIRVDGGRSLTL